MTAPLTTRPLSIADPHFCYLSPASTVASDFSFSSPIMPPLQPDFNDNAPASRRKSKSKSPKASSSNNGSSGGGFTFITATDLKEMKSKKHMTIVRKQAMTHYLENEKERKDSKDGRSRLDSEASEVSRSSITSLEGAELSTRPKLDRRRSSQKKQVSRLERTLPTNNDSQASETRLVQTKIPGAGVFGPETVFLPMGPVEERIFDQRQVPLLKSIGRALDPFRTMFQSGNPRVSVEELKYACSQYYGTVGLGRLWIPTCVQRPHSFLSTLFLAAVYRDVISKHEVESLETVALRQDIIHMVSEDFLDASKRLDDHNIIAVSQLVIGEVIARNDASRAYHERGMENMITARGIENIGLYGRIASAVSWVHLTSAVLRETQPRPMYHEYIKKHTVKNYSTDAKVPESPIYHPRTKFFTLEGSRQCDEKTLALLNEIRLMTELFLQESSGTRRNSVALINHYKSIVKYTSVARLMRTNVLTERDWKYEAIRITAVVLATALIRRIALSAALEEAGASPKKSMSIYTDSTASRSNESVFSTTDPQQVSPMTEYSASPTFQIHDPVTGKPDISFDTPTVDFDLRHPSISSTHRSSLASIHRPSLSSIPSATSSDFTYFPKNASRKSTSTSHSQGSLLQELRDALDKSNLSYAWKDMAGVLFWIGLVMGAASNGNADKHSARYYSATALRAGIMLCFEHPEAVHTAVLKMTDLVELLGGEEQGDNNQSQQSAAKRRRPITTLQTSTVSHSN